MRHATHNTEHGTHNAEHKLRRAPYFVSRRSGYIALVSALIITAAIVLIVTTLGQVAFFGRAAISEVHFKEISRALSEACVNTALLKLADSPSYAGNETITVASDTCKIFAITSSDTGRTVGTQGVFEQAYTNFRVTVATNTVDIIKWEELKSF